MTSFASFWKYISVRTAQQQHVDSLAPHVSLQVVKYSLARIGTSSPFARIPRSFIVARLEKHSVVTSTSQTSKAREGGDVFQQNFAWQNPALRERYRRSPASAPPREPSGRRRHEVAIRIRPSWDGV
jgi:hypothetical protein